MPTQSIAHSAGDESFQLLITPYQRELLVHCYRMLGSPEDAEDALQETWLRAWRRLDSLKDQAALRAWLYRIATNVALDMIAQRKARWLATAKSGPADPGDQLPPPVNDPIWIEPLPDNYLDQNMLGPEARYEIHESVTLAFLAALQQLPGRQRAVFLLRDVLGWRASEAADLLGISLAAANSALQRARVTLKKHQLDRAFATVRTSDQQIGSLLHHYVQAWETGDAARLVSLLREDAVLTMPPIPAWYRGARDIRRFLESFLFAGSAQGRFRLLSVRANGCPAYALYQRDEGGIYRSAALHILTVDRDQIAQIDDFLDFDQKIFKRFNLPPVTD